MIPVIDDLLEVVLLLAFESLHLEVIYDEQVQMLDFFKELEFVALKSGKLEFVHQPADSVVSYFVSDPAGSFAKSTGEERFPGAGRPAYDDCRAVFQIFSSG